MTAPWGFGTEWSATGGPCRSSEAVQQIAACILALTCYGNQVEDFGVSGI
jgi:hypothetical protein